MVPKAAVACASEVDSTRQWSSSGRDAREKKRVLPARVAASNKNDNTGVRQRCRRRRPHDAKKKKKKKKKLVVVGAGWGGWGAPCRRRIRDRERRALDGVPDPTGRTGDARDVWEAVRGRRQRILEGLPKHQPSRGEGTTTNRHSFHHHRRATTPLFSLPLSVSLSLVYF